MTSHEKPVDLVHGSKELFTTTVECGRKCKVN
jgi:hypothetical protein